MTRFTFEGQGRTVDDGPPWLLIIIIALLCSGGGGGAVAAAVAGLIDLAMIVLLVAVIIGAAFVAFLFYRLRHPQAVLPGVRPYVVHQLAPEPERPAIAPREVHHHQHNHLHIAPGTDLSGLGGLFTGETITEGNQ